MQRVLFITRKYPPQSGGMEQFSSGLISHYQLPKEAIILNKNQLNLIWFLPYAFFKGLGLILIKPDIKLIHLGDGVLAPLGYLLKLVSGRKVVMTAHGLDINFNHFLYQKIMPFFFRRMGKVICVSRATQNECLKKGISLDNLQIIPNGIEPEAWLINLTRAQARQKLSETLRFSDLTGKKILLSVGRLAKRKGFRWFIENVMPKLPDNYIYLIIGGSGEIRGLKNILAAPISEKSFIQETINMQQLGHRVFLPGYVDIETLKSAYLAADIFIMPNIKVPGDMEGYGIVVLEANAMGLTVIGSGIEGLKDSLAQNEFNQLIIDHENPDAWIKPILDLDLDPEQKNQLSTLTKENFSWSEIAQTYARVFAEMTID